MDVRQKRMVQVQAAFCWAVDITDNGPHYASMSCERQLPIHDDWAKWESCPLPKPISNRRWVEKILNLFDF